MRLIALLALLAVPLAASAQEAPKPSPEHKLLQGLVGTWEATMKADDKEHKSTAVYKMDLGGLWLAGSMEGELFGSKFVGKSFESYHSAKKKYVSVWVDSMSTAPVVMEGDYNKEKKELTMVGEGPGHEGRMTKYRSITRFPTADTMEFLMYIGDTKDPTFIVHYKRKK